MTGPPISKDDRWLRLFTESLYTNEFGDPPNAGLPIGAGSGKIVMVRRPGVCEPMSMSHAKLPGEVRALLDHHVDSFEKLELLVLLDRSRDRRLDVRSIGLELQLANHQVEEAVEQLQASGLVVRSGHVVGAGTRQGPLRTLIQLYAEDRITVMRAMSEISMARIRNLAARAFAAAFAPTKDQGDDDDG